MWVDLKNCLSSIVVNSSIELGTGLISALPVPVHSKVVIV